MKLNFIKVHSFFCLLIFITSCNRPVCKNDNAIFDKYAPDSKEYKDELVKQLAKIDKSKLTYWMDSYQEVGNEKYINAQIQGEGLCAKIVLTINDSQKGIEGILSTKGKGYSGAELKNLNFDIEVNNTTTDFVFQEIDRIVD